MINRAYAFQTLEKRFGSQEFTAGEAAEALSSLFSRKTAFVALSNLSKSGSLSRIKKGLYAVRRQEEDATHGLEPLKRPEITLPKSAYVTGTYALSVSLTPYSSPSYLDIFVRDVDYPALRASFEETAAYPQPRVYPFATKGTTQLERTVDGFPIPRAPEVAFVDLVKIASEKCRPVNFEYEIAPYILQLTDRWPDLMKIASQKGLKGYLEAIISYTEKIAPNQHRRKMAALPSSSSLRGTRYNLSEPPKLLSFEGGTVDKISLEVERKTGILIEANKEAITSTIGNL